MIKKLYIVLLMSLTTSATTFEEYSTIDSNSTHFGSKIINRRSTNQEKRDISLSYAATNINNKEGTQVKTITVIKNLNDKNEKINIDPKLHKNENWAEAFKDNFDSYGIIPDVPDVDDLFEYVNKKHNEKQKEKEIKEETNEKKNVTHKIDKDIITVSNQKTRFEKMVEKPVTEVSSEISGEVTESKTEITKIKGDAEFLPNFNSSRQKIREPFTNLNYSVPAHSVHQRFENYMQFNYGGKDIGAYDYPKPCVHSQPIGSVTVATPSGKTFNIPSNNNSYINPYLAPAITRRPQIVQQSTQGPVAANAPVFPINSFVPALQQQQNNKPITNNFLTQQNLAGSVNTQQPPQSLNNSIPPPTQNNFPANQQLQPSQQNQNSFLSTSQRPYVSPNLYSGLNGVRGPGPNYNANGFKNDQPVYRINNFKSGFLKPNIFRSRGLKY